MNQTHRVSAVLTSDEFEKFGMVCDAKQIAKGTYLADLVRKSIARIEAKANGKQPKANGKKAANGKGAKSAKNGNGVKAKTQASVKAKSKVKAAQAKPRKTKRSARVLNSAALVN